MVVLICSQLRPGENIAYEEQKGIFPMVLKPDAVVTKLCSATPTCMNRAGNLMPSVSMTDIVPTGTELWHSGVFLLAPRVVSKGLGSITKTALGKTAIQSNIYQYSDWTASGLTFGVTGAALEGRAVTLQDITQGFALHTGLTAGHKTGAKAVDAVNKVRADIKYRDTNVKAKNTNFEKQLKANIEEIKKINSELNVK